MKSEIRWAVALLLLSAGAGANAAVFSVTSSTDAPDILPGDGICNILPPGPAPVCTLRAAIMEANFAASSDEITVPGTMGIVLGSDLPVVVNPLAIRGLDAPGGLNSLPMIDADLYELFKVDGTSLQLRNLSLFQGIAASGGALSVAADASAIVETVRFSENFAAVSGGGAIDSRGNLAVSKSHFYLNRATTAGGAIRVNGASATLTLSDSSFLRNLTYAPTAEAIAIFNGASASITNTLIDGVELLQPGEVSGGVYASNAGNITIGNSTFFGFTRSALIVESADASDTLRMFNTILSGSSLADCSLVNSGGATTQFDYNLIEDNSCAAIHGAHLSTGDPELDSSETVYKSLVRYRAPILGSPVIDAGSPAIPLEVGACLSTDQRGTVRPLDGNADGQAICDLGAIEASAFTADTFVVNYGITDAVDANPGDGICATAVAGQCTLRAAVMEANAKPGPDRILFALPNNATAINLALTAANGAEGGDLDITEALTIEGGLVDGRPVLNVAQLRADERHFEINSPIAEPVVISGLILSSGEANGVSGGSVRITGGANVTIDTVELRDNQSTVGGGAISVVDGFLDLRNSDLHDNTTGDLGAALYVGTNARAVVWQSSFWSNIDMTAPGGVREAIETAAGGRLTMTTSTVAFNSGGLHGNQPKVMSIANSTVAYNEMRGIDVSFGASVDRLDLRTTVISGNGIQGCRLLNEASADELLLDGYNLLEDGSCDVGSSNVVAPALLFVNPAPLYLTQPSGRLSRVLLPFNQAGLISPALDRAPAGSPNCQFIVDQRGLPRPVDLQNVPNGDGVCDIGAVELQTVFNDAIFANGFEAVTGVD
jgi:predicted outer membrane repeat protein